MIQTDRNENQDMRPGCPYRPAPARHRYSYGQVESAMYRLMPGWFTKLDELMDSDGPGPRIGHVQCLADKDPCKPLDDIIHDEFHGEWFQYHADGDEEW